MIPGPVPVYVDRSVLAVQNLYGELVGADALVRSRHEQVGLLTDRLAQGHRERHPGALVELTNWHPGLVGAAEDDVWSRPLEEPDFRLAVARQRGYATGDDVVPDEVRPWAAFEAGVDAALAGDVETLSTLLQGEPGLAQGRSHWPHGATLLHYATANGVETYRQVVPDNLANVLAELVARGADVNAVAHAYGVEVRPLGLLLTSSHPAHAGVADQAERLLRAAGGRGAGVRPWFVG